MQLAKIAFGCSLVFLTACAANHSGTTESDDFVEISNPFFTSSPGAPATVWVPRSSVESGMPRAGEVVKKGFSKMSETMGGVGPAVSTSAPPAAAPQVQSAPIPVPAPEQHPAITTPLKNRIALVEVKDNGLILPLSTRLERLGAGILLDRQQPASTAEPASLNMTDWGAVSTRMNHEFDAIVTVFVWAPDRVGPGMTLLGAVYDGLSGGPVRTVFAQIPSYAPADPAAQTAAVGVALDELAGRLQTALALLPWYGKVISVENDRVYMNAGSEAGLRRGQLLGVYRGSRVVPGVGFALGDRVATVELRGLVGANGAYGVIRDGNGVQADDTVAVE
jgi:hypothetical protein